MPSPPPDAGATVDPPDDDSRALERDTVADGADPADTDHDEADERDAGERAGDASDPDLSGGDPRDAGTNADADREAVASRPWGRISAVVSLVYVAVYVIDLVVLRRDASAFNAVHRFLGSAGARVVLCGVLLAVLFHLLDGLRVTLEDMAPRLLRHDLALRTAVRFVLLAAWIPAAAAVLWPAVKTWVSR